MRMCLQRDMAFARKTSSNLYLSSRMSKTSFYFLMQSYYIVANSLFVIM